MLLDAAEATGRVRLGFRKRVSAVDLNRRTLRIEETRGGSATIEAPLLLGTDGAGSVVRSAVLAARGETASETPLAHGYKELTLPPLPNGDWRLERRALHIWPRGDFMLIALPNADGSFTCTLFLAFEGNAQLRHAGGAGGAAGVLPGPVPGHRAGPPRSRGRVRGAPHRNDGDGEGAGLARRRRRAAPR